jgi:Tfp pilus assembly protein PilO
MYFIPQKLWLFQYAGFFSAPKRYFASFMLMMVLIFFWYFLCFTTLVRFQNFYQQMLSEQRNKLQVYEALKKEYNERQQKIISHQQNLAILYNHQKTFEDRIAILFNVLHQNNLTLQNYSPAPLVQKKNYSKTAVFFVTDGSFEDIMQFLNDLSKATLLSVIQIISIQKLQKNVLRFSGALKVYSLHEKIYE